MTKQELIDKIAQIKQRPNPKVYTRITGYYRATENFNDAKLAELKQRKHYKVA